MNQTTVTYAHSSEVATADTKYSTTHNHEHPPITLLPYALTPPPSSLPSLPSPLPPGSDSEPPDNRPSFSPPPFLVEAMVAAKRGVS